LSQARPCLRISQPMAAAEGEAGDAGRRDQGRRSPRAPSAGSRGRRRPRPRASSDSRTPRGGVDPNSFIGPGRSPSPRRRSRSPRAVPAARTAITRSLLRANGDRRDHVGSAAAAHDERRPAACMRSVQTPHASAYPSSFVPGPISANASRSSWIVASRESGKSSGSSRSPCRHWTR